MTTYAVAKRMVDAALQSFNYETMTREEANEYLGEIKERLLVFYKTLGK